jgi:hypothetical protein
MLAEARSKTGGRARLVWGDIRDLPVLGAFDLVWCLGDALNYLDTPGELTAALTGMRSNLAPDGVVVFDVNTLGTFRTVYSSLLAIPGPERIVLLEGRGSRQLEAGGWADTWIDRIEPQDTGWWERTRSEHHHRHHTEAAIRSALARAGLACHRVLGTHPTGVTESPLDELHHTKAVYIARHQAS